MAMLFANRNHVEEARVVLIVSFGTDDVYRVWMDACKG